MKSTSNESLFIFIYARKSRFSGAGESIENQIEMCKEYAQRQFSQPCDFRIYEDEGFSAKNVDRPQWQQLMSDMDKKKCNVLICYRLDRISRSVSDFSSIMDHMVDRNIDFVSVRENFDTSTPMGRAMIYIASVFAQLERETITERIKDNKFKLYRTGSWQGGKAPLGFRSIKSSYHDEGGAKRHMYVLEAVPEEQEHIRMLYDKFEELGSMTALDGYLLEHKILSSRGSEYCQGTLRQLLINPIYAPNSPIVYDYLASKGCDIVDGRAAFDGTRGLIAYARTVTKGTKKTTRTHNAIENWIIASGDHQGVISPEQWVRVQQTITRNGQLHPRQGTSHTALLSGLIRCQQCGSPMIIKGNRNNAAGEKVFYYVCNRKSRSHGKLCDMANIQGIQFDKYVVNTLKDSFASTGSTFTALDSSFHTSQAQAIDFNKKIKSLERQLETNNNASISLATKMAYTQSEAEDNALRQAIQSFAAESKKLQADLEQTRKMSLCSESGLLNFDLMKKSVQSFVENFDGLSLDEQRLNIKNIIQTIEWDGVNASIHLFPAIESAKKKQR